MTNDHGILIKNIYYMLTYAFKELRQNNYEQIAGEDFENIHELFAEILGKGISYLLKQGLHKEYIAAREATTTLRGKLEISGTLREKWAQRQQLVCEYDLFSENNLFNQILKTTTILLVHHPAVRNSQKRALQRLLLYFEQVDTITLSRIPWHRLRYDRNSRSYQMLHGFCYLLFQNQLLTTEEGPTSLMQFSDEHMNLLFQRFVLAYYQRHHNDYKASARQIKWKLEPSDRLSANVLPIMQTDITLTIGERTLIIDTKYYSKPMQENYGKPSLHSAHLYQIHTYVTSEDSAHIGKVDGLLLYAMTSDTVQPKYQGTMPDGNIIMAQSLNLNQDFQAIKQQLETLTSYAVL